MYPSENGMRRSSMVQALRAWTAGGTVSDHLMVVADLQIGG